MNRRDVVPRAYAGSAVLSLSIFFGCQARKDGHGLGEAVTATLTQRRVATSDHPAICIIALFAYGFMCSLVGFWPEFIAPDGWARKEY